MYTRARGATQKRKGSATHKSEVVSSISEKNKPTSEVNETTSFFLRCPSAKSPDTRLRSVKFELKTEASGWKRRRDVYISMERRPKRTTEASAKCCSKSIVAVRAVACSLGGVLLWMFEFIDLLSAVIVGGFEFLDSLTRWDQLP